MGKRLFVRPDSGKIVRFPHPSYKILKREGERVPNTSYWRRRIKDCDVFLIKENKKIPIPAPLPAVEGRGAPNPKPKPKPRTNNK